jgi:hypothetical protein
LLRFLGSWRRRRRTSHFGLEFSPRNFPSAHSRNHLSRGFFRTPKVTGTHRKRRGKNSQQKDAGPQSDLPFEFDTELPQKVPIINQTSLCSYRLTS